jgi:hypothetical protein
VRSIIPILVVGIIAFAVFDFAVMDNRPWILNRTSAARIIEHSAQFLHKTKLRFEIDQQQAWVPGVCHNYEFRPESQGLVSQYLASGLMKFSPYRNQGSPMDPSVGSLDLRDADFLADETDNCERHPVRSDTGVYELKLGNAMVEVLGIRKDKNRALVDFRWQFDSLNEIGKILPSIRSAIETEKDESRLSAAENAIIPFWTGSAEIMRYDNGWRLNSIELKDWDVGPNWPDPSFNWGAFDEHENHF